MDESADFEMAANQIVFGKFTNAGQTCVSPNYLVFLGSHGKYEEFIQKLVGKLSVFIGKYEHLVKVINLQKFEQLQEIVV